MSREAFDFIKRENIQHERITDEGIRSILKLQRGISLTDEDIADLREMLAKEEAKEAQRIKNEEANKAKMEQLRKLREEKAQKEIEKKIAEGRTTEERNPDNQMDKYKRIKPGYLLILIGVFIPFICLPFASNLNPA